MDKQQFAKQLGQNIAQYRQTLGLTQEQLAEKLELGNEAVSRIERGIAMPSLMRLLAFANIFQCDVSDLLLKREIALNQKWTYLIAQVDELPLADQHFVLETLQRLTYHLAAKR